MVPILAHLHPLVIAVTVGAGLFFCALCGYLIYFCFSKNLKCLSVFPLLGIVYMAATIYRFLFSSGPFYWLLP